jgi:hypothetical protein
MHELDARDHELLAAYREQDDPPPGAMDRVYDEVLLRVQPVVLPTPWLKSAAVSFAIAAGVLLAVRGVAMGTRAARQTVTPQSMQAPMSGQPASPGGETTMVAPTKATERTAVVTPAPAATAPVVPEEEVAPQEPAIATPSKTKARTKATPTASDLAADLELLAQAKRTDDPTERLALLREHAATHGKSKLAEEREVLTIEAMCTLGKSADARSRAEGFRTRFPGSAFAGRVSRSCAEAG